MRPVHPVIHDGNVHLHRQPHVGPSLNISALRQLDCALPIRGFAIKYVLEGTEHYTVNGDPFPVKAGHYLLANRHGATHIGIKSAHAVKGLCIDLTSELIDEVAGGMMHPGVPLDPEIPSFFTSEEFLESTNKAERTALGPMLDALAKGLFDGSMRTLERSVYYVLAERVVEDHRALLPRLRSIPAVRPGTRKEIYRRVQRAKEFMDDHTQGQPDVADVAREVAMSEYHFFRAFRAVMGTTPHRYMMMQRLENAHAMLKHGHGSVLDVALLTGFADASSFSKAFRKFHGFVPSDTVRASRGI